MIEVLFSPAEFSALAGRDLSRTTCIVFDVLRATSSMLTALSNGASEIIPVISVSEALEMKERRPDVLLAGERDGFRIGHKHTGSVEFDFGNSPRDFTHDRVGGKTIVWTTTNGTRALRSCASAEVVLVGAFLNLSAIADWVHEHMPKHLLLIASGTFEHAALEDALAAGALCNSLWSVFSKQQNADSAEIARRLYLESQHDIKAAVMHSQRARILLARKELAPDVPLCLEFSLLGILASLNRDGVIRRCNS